MSADQHRNSSPDAGDVGIDARLYREIRLEALKDSPEAFGSTFEVESSQPVSWFADRLGSSTVLGAFRGPELVATAGFAIQQGQKRAHKGLLWGMYVRPPARASGIGRRLIEAIFDVARPHVELIQLTVVRDNARARRLDMSLGFVDYGLETKPSSRTAATTTSSSWRRNRWRRSNAGANRPIEATARLCAAGRRGRRRRRGGRRRGCS